MFVQYIDLNMVPGGIPPVVNVNQYDVQNNAIVFTLYNDGEYFNIPSGASVIVNGTKPDKKGFSYSASSFSTTNHTVTANVTNQMTAVAGDVVCELKIRNAGESIGTANFILRVEEAALGEETPLSETEIPLIEQAVDIAANLEEYISGTKANAEASAASAESASKSATNAETFANEAKVTNQNLQQIYSSLENSKTSANTAAANAQSVADTLQEKLDAGELKGEKGDKGDQGEAGVVTNLSGYVYFAYNEADGHLYAYSSTSMADNFEYDEATGHLYYKTAVE